MATLTDLHLDLAQVLDEMMRVTEHYHLNVIPTVILRDPNNNEGSVIMTAENGAQLELAFETLRNYKDRKTDTEGTSREACEV
jgi:hypothetical protein